MSVPEVMSKADFARHMGVSRAAVTDWCKRGIITAEAIVGEGRKAKLKTEIAIGQVQKNRDPGQATGNGVATGAGVPAQPGKEKATDSGPSLQEEIQREALRSKQLANERAVTEAMRRRGDLVDAGEAKAEMGRIAAQMMTLFEASIADMATAMARRFDLPVRDVRHALDAEFRDVRTRVSTRERTIATAMPEDMQIEAA